jgi:hypothetical protein
MNRRTMARARQIQHLPVDRMRVEVAETESGIGSVLGRSGFGATVGAGCHRHPSLQAGLAEPL